MKPKSNNPSGPLVTFPLTIDVANGFLILKLEDIVIEKFDKDLKTELDNLIRFETDKQLNQFSIIYFNKLKLNSKISHE